MLLAKKLISSNDSGSDLVKVKVKIKSKSESEQKTNVFAIGK